MEQFLYLLDPDTRKITRSLEKIELKVINCFTVFNKTCLNICIYTYVKFTNIEIIEKLTGLINIRKNKCIKRH